MPELNTSEALRGRERRLSGSIILGVPIVLIIITFLFWYQTWFGRQLSDADLREYLEDTSVPHKTQHALTQVAAEILRHDPSVEGVYPLVVSLAANKEAGLRSMTAWVMGQDNKSAAFHQALLKLVNDPEPTVRWNAALALARFSDPAGEPQLKLMLSPYTLAAPVAGAITFRVTAADAVRNGIVVARVKSQGSNSLDIRSPVGGIFEKRLVAEGATVAAGDSIGVISPDDQQVWEALRALYLVGQPEDLGDVDRFSRPADGVSDRVRQQAVLTAEAIRKRAGDSTEKPDSKGGVAEANPESRTASTAGRAGKNP